MKTIHGYEMIGQLSPQNAGCCEWGFCKKNGHEYFIKKFTEAPPYPVDREIFSPEAFERKIKICEAFYKERSEFYRVLRMICRTGNNVVVEDFFREGTKYYAVQDKVENSKISLEELACLSPAKKEVLIRSILYSVAVFHDAGIVHSDIKTNNILLKKTCDGFITAKIIDFDEGFLVNAPPAKLKGDFLYFSPEFFLKSNGEDIKLTQKTDIFALGILFHQYYTGMLPTVSEKDRYCCIAALNGNEIKLDESLSPFIKDIIKSMLEKEPQKRLSARELLKRFEEKDSKTIGVIRENGTGIAGSSSLTEQALDRGGFYIPDDLG